MDERSDRGWWRGRTPEVFAASRRLRAEMTEAERVLWQRIRRGQLSGFRFRRQHAIGRFILDFYCAELLLAVEVDGGVHDDPLQAERDTARTAALERRGIRVVRVRNEEVLPDPARALARIRSAAVAVLDPPHPTEPRHGTR